MCFFPSFREIFSNYSLVFRKQMVFNKLNSNCNEEWMMIKFKMKLCLQKCLDILFCKGLYFFLVKILTLINGGWMCVLLSFKLVSNSPQLKTVYTGKKKKKKELRNLIWKSCIYCKYSFHMVIKLHIKFGDIVLICWW